MFQFLKSMILGSFFIFFFLDAYSAPGTPMVDLVSGECRVVNSTTATPALSFPYTSVGNSILIDGGSFIPRTSSTASPTSVDTFLNFVASSNETYIFATISLNQPELMQPSPTSFEVEPTITVNDPPLKLFYILGGTSQGEVCVYEYILSIDVNGNINRSVPVSVGLLSRDSQEPTSIPIFNSFGLIATISGLLWFGRRRSIKLKNL